MKTFVHTPLKMLHGPPIWNPLARQDRSSTETVELSDGRRQRPGVCRTAYVFPGIGLGVTMSRSTRIRDEMIIAAAEVRSESNIQARPTISRSTYI